MSRGDGVEERIEEFKRAFRRFLRGTRRRTGEAATRSAAAARRAKGAAGRAAEEAGGRAAGAARAARHRAGDARRFTEEKAKSGAQRAARKFFQPMQVAVESKFADVTEALEQLPPGEEFDRLADELRAARLSCDAAVQYWEEGRIKQARRLYRLAAANLMATEAALARHQGLAPDQNDELADAPQYVPKWRRTLVDNDDLDGDEDTFYLQDAQTFRTHVMAIQRKELGLPTLRELKLRVLDPRAGKAEATDDDMDHLQAADLLGVQDRILIDQFDDEGDGSDLDASDTVDEEDFDLHQLEEVTDRIAGIIGDGDDEVTEIKRLALEMSKRALKQLLRQAKSWKSAVASLGAGGPALYLEAHVLAPIVEHMDMDVKEGVPKSSGRAARGAAADIVEGTTDVVWNVAALAAEAAFTPLTNFGTGAIGAGYKSAFAAASAKGEGANSAKAAAIAGVTAVLEYLQALIPYYGSIAGVGGGAKGIADTADVSKRVRRLRQGFKEEPVASPVQRAFVQALEERIAHAQRLIQQGRRLGELDEVAKLEEILEYLVRQRDKTHERLRL